MKMFKIIYSLIFLILMSALLLSICSPKEKAPVLNTLSNVKMAEGWKLLFDGKTLNGWKYKPGGWKVEDNAMALVEKGGYIWTEGQYGNFILDCEFKISPDCNSGIFFRTGDLEDVVQTGFEIQVIDSYGKAEPDKHDCGALYDIAAPNNNTVKPVGEWNHTVITCKDNIITIELNGVQVVKVDLDEYTTPNMNVDGTKNKFNTALKNFPQIGFIGFQDHGYPVWFRNVKLKVL